MFKVVEGSALTLAEAASGSPITTTVVVLLFYFFFNVIEASIEKLAFGERFTHWLDPFFGVAFIAYAAYAVYACALHNSRRA